MASFDILENMIENFLLILKLFFCVMNVTLNQQVTVFFL